MLLRHETGNTCSGFTSYQSHYQKGEGKYQKQQAEGGVSHQCHCGPPIWKGPKQRKTPPEGFWTLPVACEVPLTFSAFFQRRWIWWAQPHPCRPLYHPLSLSPSSTKQTSGDSWKLHQPGSLDKSLCPVTWQHRNQSSLPAGSQTFRNRQDFKSNGVQTACFQGVNWGTEKGCDLAKPTVQPSAISTVQSSCCWSLHICYTCRSQVSKAFGPDGTNAAIPFRVHPGHSYGSFIHFIKSISSSPKGFLSSQ